VAVNEGDSAATVQQYVKEGHFTFPIVMGGRGRIFQQYHVEAYPTNYLIDTHGKVVYRSLGFDESGLRAALEQMGLK
jgi:hypothetical protein